MGDPVVYRVRTALVFATVAALLPGLLVYLGVEPVLTAFIPSVLCVVPFFVRSGPLLRHATLGAMILMAVFIVLGSMSIGFLFVPAFVGLAVAADQARGCAARPVVGPRAEPSDSRPAT